MVNRFTEFLHFEEPLVRTFSMHPCVELRCVSPSTRWH